MNFKLFLENSNYDFVYHVSPENNIYKLKGTGSNSGVQSVNHRKSGIYVAPTFKDAIEWFFSFVAGKKTSKLKFSGGYSNKEKVQHKYEFRQCTIYKIKIPKKILEKSWFSNFWEPEYFIEEEYLNLLTIESKKTYDWGELMQIRSGIKNNFTNFKLGYTTKHFTDIIKTNLAAKIYTDLSNLYSTKKLQGFRTIYEDKIIDLLNSLLRYCKKYNDNNMKYVVIDKLNKQQEEEVELIKYKIIQLINKMIK